MFRTFKIYALKESFVVVLFFGRRVLTMLHGANKADLEDVAVEWVGLCPHQSTSVAPSKKMCLKATLHISWDGVERRKVARRIPQGAVATALSKPRVLPALHAMSPVGSR